MLDGAGWTGRKCRVRTAWCQVPSAKCQVPGRTAVELWSAGGWIAPGAARPSPGPSPLVPRGEGRTAVGAPWRAICSPPRAPTPRPPAPASRGRGRTSSRKTVRAGVALSHDGQSAQADFVSLLRRIHSLGRGPDFMGGLRLSARPGIHLASRPGLRHGASSRSPHDLPDLALPRPYRSAAMATAPSRRKRRSGARTAAGARVTRMAAARKSAASAMNTVA